MVLLGTLAGGMLAFVVAADSITGQEYESSASLIVELPESFSGDATRFVDLQVLILGSRSLAADVASQIGGDATSIQQAISVEQELGADVLTVAASSTDADRAQELVDAYLAAYLEQLEEESASETVQEIQRVDARISEVEEQLQNASNDIASGIKEYLQDSPRAAENQATPLEAVAAPVAVARRTALQLEYEQLLAERSDLTRANAADARVRVLEGASPATRVSSMNGLVAIVAGAFIGFSGGAASAAILARLRQDAIDPSTAGEIIDVPIVGSVQRYPRIEDLRTMFFNGPPQTDLTTIDRIAGMAAAASTVDNALRIGIVSLQEDTSTTSMSLALAQNFLARDASVLVIDTNSSDISVSRLFGVDHLTDMDRLPADGNGSLRTSSAEKLAVDVGRDGLKVVKLTTAIPSRDRAGSNVGYWRFRRGAIGDILRSRDGSSDVILLDAGTLGSSLAGVSSFEWCDAVVLAVDLEVQTVQSLSAASRRLESASTRLLPVTVRS